MNIFGSPSILLPVPEQDIQIVRGDVAKMVLGFTVRPDIVANPSQYRLRFVLRRRQSDGLPDLAAIQADLEINPPDEFNGVAIDVLATINVPTNVTQALPPQGCVYFVEWTNAIGGDNSRILQGRVVLED